MVLKWLTYWIKALFWKKIAPWQQKKKGLQLNKGYYWKVIPQIHPYLGEK
jgi:hypothetical protein